MNKRHYEHTLPNIRGSLSLFLVQFVDSLLVLFQMLAQHGIHISAY